MERVRIRDGTKSDLGSGINIPDPQHWFLPFSVVELQEDWTGVLQLQLLSVVSPEFPMKNIFLRVCIEREGAPQEHFVMQLKISE